MYDEEKEEGACVDINECNAGTDRCDENALCFNEMGTYQCRCKVGYSGDGFTCQSMFSSFKIIISYNIVFQCHINSEETACSRVRCAAHSRCYETPAGDPECRCLPGYQDVDNQCRPLSSTQTDCRQDHRCDINAQCVYSSQMDQYRCQCLAGFKGDGLNCTRTSGKFIS